MSGMKPRIEILPEKKLIGKSLRMSLVNNLTHRLWRSFMTERSAIRKRLGTDKYSIQLYDANYFKAFNPNTEFTKWAAVEVADFDYIPIGFSPFVLPSGRYAVFVHKGPSSEFPKTMQFIFGQWLPRSAYELDHRPHFELLGDTYKNNEAHSEEEVWIPIKEREPLNK